MTLEFEQAVKALDEHIEVLKQHLIALMTEPQAESAPTTLKIITVKRELDKAMEEKMKLSQIYCRPLSVPYL